MTIPMNTTFDENKLNALLDKGAFDEARTYIESVFQAPETQKDKVDMAIDYAQIYMRVMTKVNRRYTESLKAAEKTLASLKAEQTKADDIFKAAEIKLSMKK